MRARALILAGLFATPVWAQETPDAGFGLIDPGQQPLNPEVMPVPESQPQPVPEPQPLPEPIVQAPEPQPDPPPPFAHRVEATGYLSTRGGFSRSHLNGLIPTKDLPQFTGLVELNGQVKVKYVERSFVYGDVSLIAQAGGMFRGTVGVDDKLPRLETDTDGAEFAVPDHDVAATRPSVSLNELYVLHEFLPALNVLVGKKRLVWGSGQAYNPTDLLNIRKDPTDPTFQRAGAWMARVEVPLETMAFTAVFAPGLLEQSSGIPRQFVTYPGWDKQDDEVHYLVALRAYALISDADVNLMLFHSNLYGDSFHDKLRVGGSFSRYFFTDYEFHTELLIGSGSNRDYVTPACVASPSAAFACFQAKTPFVTKSKLDDGSYYPKLLVGSRRQFDDESFLSVEYLYQAEGYSASEFRDQANALDLTLQLKKLGVQIPSLNPTTNNDGIPERFTFDPQVQHYLFLTYNKPRIFDDFTAQLVTIVNLQDLSTVWSPSVSWSTTEWLTLSALGFFPVPGLDSLGPKRLSNDQHVTEYGNSPIAYRAVLEARIFY